MLKIKIQQSRDGQWYATIHARNWQVLFTSELYKRRVNCWNVISIIVGRMQTGTYEIIDTTKKVA